MHVETRTSDEPESSERAWKARQDAQAVKFGLCVASGRCVPVVNSLFNVTRDATTGRESSQAFQGMERKRMVPFTRLGFNHQGRPATRTRQNGTGRDEPTVDAFLWNCSKQLATLSREQTADGLVGRAKR